MFKITHLGDQIPVILIQKAMLKKCNILNIISSLKEFDFVKSDYKMNSSLSKLKKAVTKNMKNKPIKEVSISLSKESKY